MHRRSPLLAPTTSGGDRQAGPARACARSVVRAGFARRRTVLARDCRLVPVRARPHGRVGRPQGRRLSSWSRRRVMTRSDSRSAPTCARLRTARVPVSGRSAVAYVRSSSPPRRAGAGQRRREDLAPLPDSVLLSDLIGLQVLYERGDVVESCATFTMARPTTRSARTGSSSPRRGLHPLVGVDSGHVLLIPAFTSDGLRFASWPRLFTLVSGCLRLCSQRRPLASVVDGELELRIFNYRTRLP